MKKIPTFADHAVRFLLGNPQSKFPRMRSYPALRMAKTIANARRFVLDDEMSAFMADLANAAFMVDITQNTHLIEQTRMMCRLPHQITWIEYNHHVRRQRQRDEYYMGKRAVRLEHGMSGDKAVPQYYMDDLASDDEVPAREAWLLEQHPQLDIAFRATTFVLVEGQPVPFAMSWAWTVDDTMVPWEPITAWDPESHPAILTGVLGYKTPHVRAVMWDKEFGKKLPEEFVRNNMSEWGGDLRYLWALLSTINDIPVTMSPVTPSKGFFAKGQYRKFLSHSIVRLKVPTKYDNRKLAQKVVGLSRKRAHMVRGHWRTLRLTQRKVWIKEHQRGDASLGWVTHDYTVERGDQV